MNKGRVSMEVTSNGTGIPGDYKVNRISIRQQVNRICRATLDIFDGSAAGEKFEISSSEVFSPGAEIVISLGYEGTNQQVFSGIVIKQNLQIDPVTGPTLCVECRDKAIRMTVGRKNSVYQKEGEGETDSVIMSSLIGQYEGLKAKVSKTSVSSPCLVQYYASDWDFLISRAEINGLLVSTNSGTVSVFSPCDDTKSVLTVTYGENLNRFHLELNAADQLSNVQSSAWDYKNQQLVSESAPNNLSGPGNLSSKKLSEVVGLDKFELQTSAAVDSEGLSQWAKAQMLKSELSKITGEVCFPGESALTAGKYITINGLGSRFDGDHFISVIKHDYSDGNWISSAEVGLSPEWFVQDFDVMAPPAAGLLPGAEGLYNATVKQIDKDPDSAYRILVELPLFNDKGKGIWARLVNFYSSNGFGAFFLPEIGDEVIVAFLNQDPRFPVILGSVYSENRKPYSELSPDDENSQKAIVTKSELQIVFDDKNSVMTLKTKKGNLITFSDKDEKITIQDQNNNSCVMSSSGMEMKSPSSITIQADKNIVINGKMGVTIESASGDVKVSANNINANAKMALSAKGSMTAEVQGGTELTLKGGMVMIN